MTRDEASKLPKPDNVIDVLVYKNNRSKSALKRVAKEKKENPTKYKELGALGGKVTGVKKGAATLTLEERQERGRKGMAVRWNREGK